MSRKTSSKSTRTTPITLVTLRSARRAVGQFPALKAGAVGALLHRVTPEFLEKNDNGGLLLLVQYEGYPFPVLQTSSQLKFCAKAPSEKVAKRVAELVSFARVAHKEMFATAKRERAFDRSRKPRAA